MSIGQTAVAALFVWEGNRRYSVALATLIDSDISTYGLSGLEKGGEHFVNAL